MVTVSIIVPAYNIATYLRKTIRSILNQTFNNFELILIDDGSNDGTSEYCDSVAKQDNRIKVIHKSNGGVSSARNLGIDLSRGQWITFVDGDDYLVPEYLERMVRAANNESIEMVCCNLATVNLDQSVSQYPFLSESDVSTQRILNGFFSDEIIKSQFYGPYNKLIRASSLKSLKFKNYSVGEDVLFMFELLMNIKCVRTIPFVGYYYIKRVSSATTSKFSLKKLDYVKAAHIIEDLSERISEQISNKATIWTMRHSIVTLRQIFKNRMSVECNDFIREEICYLKSKSHLLHYLGFKRNIDYFLIRKFPSLYYYFPI